MDEKKSEQTPFSIIAVPIFPRGGRVCHAFVDEEDYEIVSKFRWTVNSNGYCASVGNGRSVLMHRLIMAAPQGMIVDHVNGVRHHNMRSNLRLATPLENSWNSRYRRDKISQWAPYKGVSFYGRKWHAHIRAAGKDGKRSRSLHFGPFESAEEAAKAYDEAARKHHGQFACVNFPLKGERGALE